MANLKTSSIAITALGRRTFSPSSRPQTPHFLKSGKNVVSYPPPESIPYRASPPKPFVVPPVDRAIQGIDSFTPSSLHFSNLLPLGPVCVFRLHEGSLVDPSLTATFIVSVKKIFFFDMI